MLLVDVVGNADKLAPLQIVATGVNVGVTFGVTVTTVAAEVTLHAPLVTVTV